MNIFRNIPPTAGLPFSAGELIAAYRNRHAGDMLARDFQGYLGSPFTAITCSGTSALYIICETLKELSPKRTILIPSFICPLVAFAIRRAGFFIELYDIGPADFNGDVSKIASACAANPDMAAVLVSHLGGLPVNMPRLRKTVRELGIFIIEDCAQSFGALRRGRPVGTLGDFSFFSLAAGKGLTIYEGGVLVANTSAFAGLIAAKIQQLVMPDKALETKRIIELLGYAVFYRPLLFWYVFTLPELYWSRRGNDIKALREDFSIDFPIHAVSDFRKAVGHAAFPRIDEAIDNQRAKAACYIDGLSSLEDITVLQEAPEDKATYPYVTVLFNRPEQKVKALRAFAGAGLGVSQIYARALADYGYLRGMVPNSNSAGARRLAARAITLSTSPFIKKRHLEKCLKIMHTIF